MYSERRAGERGTAPHYLLLGTLSVAVAPVGAPGRLPLPVLVGAGCDIADSGGRCCNPNAIAPIAALTIAVHVAAVDVHVPIDGDVAVDAAIDVCAALHVPIECRAPINVGATMHSRMTATDMVPTAASRVARCHK